MSNRQTIEQSCVMQSIVEKSFYHTVFRQRLATFRMTDRVLKRIFLIWAGLILSLGGFAEKHVATAQTDTGTVQIGDHIKLTISLQTDEKNTVIFPVLSDTMDSKIEFVSVGKLDTIFDQTHHTRTYSQLFTLSIFEPGIFTIPEIPFFVKTPTDKDFIDVPTNAVSITVLAPNVNLDEEIKDIQDVWKVSSWELFLENLREKYAPYILILLGLGVLTVVGIYVYRKWKNKEPLFMFAPKPVIPPHVQALEDLEKLRLKQLWQTNLVKEYYTELTDILRVYIEKSLQINAVEMTSDELIEATENSSLEGKTELLAYLRNVLPTADLVKFAKSMPLADEHDRCFKDVKQFVELTMPKTEEEKS